jgi:AcrR family transcriptional regulator
LVKGRSSNRVIIPMVKGRPKTQSDDDLRQRIVTAAHACFVAHGFGRCSTAAIAAAAQLSKRDLYRIFPGKQDVFAAVIADRLPDLLDLPQPKSSRAGEAMSLEDTLVRIFRLDLDAKAADERDAMINLFAREALQYPVLSDLIYDSGIIRAREDLASWLEEQNRRGRLRVADTTNCAGLLMDVVFGALLPKRRHKGAIDRRRQRVEIRRRLQIVLLGLQAVEAS